MILLTHICSDQTLPIPSLDNTALSWIHAELLSIYFWLYAPNFFCFQGEFISILRLRSRDVTFDYIILYSFPPPPLHSLYWVTAYPGAQHFSISQRWPLMTDLSSAMRSLLWIEMSSVSNQPSRSAWVCWMKCSWSSRQTLWVHTPTHKNKHVNRGVCISLSFHSLCSLIMYFFLVNSSDNRSRLDLS